MPTVEETLKTIETAEALLPSVKNEEFREHHRSLLWLGKELCKACTAALAKPETLEKLDKGSSILLNNIVEQIRLEKVLQTN